MQEKETGIQDLIYTTVQERIGSGKYEPGEKLSENSLAKEFNCSRTPVREALQKLSQNGIVIIQPKSGTYVRQHTKEEILNALEIRAYLESLAFRLDIEKNVDITSIKQCYEKMQEISKVTPLDMEKYGKQDFEFHKNLVTLAGNDFLTNIYNDLHLIALFGVFFNPLEDEDLNVTQSEHKKIIELLENKDQSGQTFIIQHLIRRRSDFI